MTPLEETTRALVHLATGVDAVLWPSVPLGAAVSIMGANESATFVASVRLFLDGLLAASVDDDGHVRLGVAA
jgi:poly-beta-hydroxyalkanoate depolymerase